MRLRCLRRFLTPVRQGERGCSGLCEGSQGNWETGREADWVCEDEGAGTQRAGRDLYCYSSAAIWLLMMTAA